MKIKYQPEIDGLRAIAVIAVILYHSNLTLYGYKVLQGGFIGVDIFFVISGYLITSIIYKELISKSSFSFKNFYERRARRILPALIFVISICMPVAWLLILPNSLVDFAKSILSSLFFSSNIYFFSTDTDYADAVSYFKPFLHTWSLSVEEQFYILFPIFFMAIFKYLRKYLFFFIFIILFLSLIISHFESKKFSILNFYFIQYRVWELLLGSMLVYFNYQNVHLLKNTKLKIILPFLGLLLIGYSLFFFNHRIYHPSFYTLVPLLGVCMIILFCNNQNELINKILSSKFFVSIGLISYSLYLWHYPIFSFYRYVKTSTGDYTNVFIIFLILLILSYLSYIFIEKPFRNKKNNFKFLILIIFIFYAVLIITNYLFILKDGFKNRFPSIISNSVIDNEKPWNMLKDTNGKNCFLNENLCFFGERNKRRIFFIGDSQMASASYDLKNKIANKNKYLFIVANRSGCIFFPKFDTVIIRSGKNTACNDIYFSKLNNLILERDSNIVIFGGRLPFYITREPFDNNEGGREYSSWFKDKSFVKRGSYDSIENSFKESLMNISQKNTIILVYPIPEVGLDVPKILYSRILFNQKNIDLTNKNNWITTSYDIFKKRSASAFALLDSINGENVHRVYPHKFFCDNLIKDRCITHNEQDIFYSDNNHPSLKGAEIINNLIIQEIEKFN